MEKDAAPAAPNRVLVRTVYVRRRHALVSAAGFGPLWEDCALHVIQQGRVLERDQDQMLRDLLACMTLHLASRPRDEMTAWTISFAEPPLNLFATGDSRCGTVCGRVFTRGLPATRRDMLFAQVTRPRLPMRTSSIEVQGLDVPDVVEQYYRHSEQLPARCFRLGGDRLAMAVAQPEIDLDWFEALTPADLEALEQVEDAALFEVRGYGLGCGCDLDTILRMLRGASQGDMDWIFGERDEVVVECPRCAGTFRVTRSRMGRFLQES